jgi:hypothetical protein
MSRVTASFLPKPSLARAPILHRTESDFGAGIINVASPHATFDPTSDPTNITITDVWWASYVSRTEKMRGKPPKKDLKIEDVKAHIAKVNQLWFALRDFRDELSKLPR